MEQIEYEARLNWDGANLANVLRLLAIYQREFCGTRDASGSDFGQGRIANVKNMEFYSDPEKRSTGSVETKNRWYNRQIRESAKGGIITERQFIVGHKKAERLVHLQIATFDREIASNIPPKRSRVTKDLIQLCTQSFPVVTMENVDSYFMTLKMILSGQMVWRNF